MASSENPQGQETSMDIVARKIEALYETPVANVMQNLGDKPLCVVTGAFGIGKSTYLIPLLQRQYANQGIPVEILDNQTAISSDRLVQKINQLSNIASDARRGILILDEAGIIASLDGNRGIKSVMEAAAQKGYQVIAVIAHGANSNTLREKSVQAWQEATESSIIDLPLLRLDKKLAREFLLATAEKFGKSFSAEVVDFILDTVPTNMGLLYILGQTADYQETIEDARTYISNYPDRLRTQFTVEEHTQFWRKLYP